MNGDRDTTREETPQIVFTDKCTHLNIEQWQELLSPFATMDFDIKQAAVLMVSFGDGMRYVQQKYKSVGAKSFLVPDIAVSKTFSETEPGRYSPFLNRIDISFGFLERLSKESPNKIVTLVDPKDGTIVQRGKTDEVFALAGVEECAHAFHEQSGFTDASHAELLEDVQTHDAQSEEYIALNWTLQYALDHKLSPEIIKSTRLRIEKAHILRKKLKIL